VTAIKSLFSPHRRRPHKLNESTKIPLVKRAGGCCASAAFLFLLFPRAPQFNLSVSIILSFLCHLRRAAIHFQRSHAAQFPPRCIVSRFVKAQVTCLRRRSGRSQSVVDWMQAVAERAGGAAQTTRWGWEAALDRAPFTALLLITGVKIHENRERDMISQQAVPRNWREAFQAQMRFSSMPDPLLHCNSPRT
jgi:hypothetical protein